MQLESFSLRISLDCPICRTHLPVNGVTRKLRCHQCGFDAPSGLAPWTSFFDAELWAEVLGFEQGTERTTSVLGDWTMKITVGRSAPRCPTCKGPPLDPAALAPLAARGQCFCPGCGTAIRVRPADDLCTQLNPQARFVVGESAPDDAALAIEAKTTPVLFACMGCGGGLTVDGSQRQVTCGYCGASSYLPDGLWQKLRPVPIPETFYVVCAYDEHARREARWHDASARRDDAARPDLPPAVYERFATDDEWTVRAAVARNPAAPPQVLDRLATDDDWEVRVAVAGNPSASQQALRQLFEESRSEIIEALCANPNLPVDCVVTLAESKSYRQRVLAAAHPALPFDHLHDLLDDDDNDVRRAAQKRLADLREQGIEAKDGRSLFRKLFG